MRPAAPNAQQVSSFEQQQHLQARRDDAEDRSANSSLPLAAMQQLQARTSVPAPRLPAPRPMTAAQRAAIYGDSPNAPQQTSNVSQAQAEPSSAGWRARSSIRTRSTAIPWPSTSRTPADRPRQPISSPRLSWANANRNLPKRAAEDIASLTPPHAANAQRPATSSPYPVRSRRSGREVRPHGRL